MKILDETEEQGSRIQKTTIKKHNEQYHSTSCASFDFEILNFQNLTRPFACPERSRRGLKHSVYVPSSKREFKMPTIGDADTPILEQVRKTEYQYKYNAKEWQDELGLNMYDYGARNYDPAIGRFFNMDPLAEVSRKFSPYAYALDNPVYFIDPDGMMATDWYKSKKGDYVYDSSIKSQKDLETSGIEGEYLGKSHTINVTQNGDFVGSISLKENGSIDTSNLNIPTTDESNMTTGVKVVDANFISGGIIYGAMKGISMNGNEFKIADNFVGNAKEAYDFPEDRGIVREIDELSKSIKNAHKKYEILVEAEKFDRIWVDRMTGGVAGRTAGSAKLQEMYERDSVNKSKQRALLQKTKQNKTPSNSNKH